MRFLSIFPFISFVLISLALAGRVIYLQQKGVRVTAHTGRKPKYLTRLYPLFALLFLAWFSELIRPVFRLPELLLPAWLIEKILHTFPLHITGLIIVSAALFLWIITLFHFKFSLRLGLDNHNLGKLITQGIFARSRNPFFLSVDLCFTGLALIHPSIFFITMALLTITTIHFFIRKEEQFLRRYYGNSYLKYQQQVRRYF
jgi:protein-S-isoprenylcysteine O-methyltransferase Ste14